MEGWVFIPFESAVQKVTYTKKIPRKQFLTDGAYPIISQESDFINGYWDNSEDVFSVDSPVVIFGDHTKIIKHIDFDFVLGADGVKILKPIETLSSKFFAYFLNAAPVADLGYARHYRLLKEITVPVPPREEQKRIVAILDEAFADIEKVRAKTEQNLKNARELFESYLQQVFSQRGEGWVKHLLGDICTFKHGFAFKGEYFCDKSEFLLLTPGNFFEEGGYRERGQKQKYYDGVFPEEYLLNKGDLIVAMTEQAAGLLGSPALIPEDGTFLHNQRLGLVELTTDFLGNVKLEFLFHLFNTSYFRSKVQETASGVKVRHTSPKKMQAIPVWIPNDLSEQEAIANKLFEIKEQSLELEQAYSDKLKHLDELKKSILQKAFSGELTQKNNQGAVA